MIVAITGGTGFIGRRLALHHVELGDTVRVLSRRLEPASDPRLEMHAGDLAEEGTAFDAFVDGAHVLYHCAGNIREPQTMRAVHVDGTARLLRAARGRVGRWVQLSSVGAYGPPHSGAVTEETPTAPRGVYESTKTESDTLVEQSGADGGIEYAILRPSIVFGPDMGNRSLYQWIGIIERGAFCFVGTPGASANYIHVANVVDALHLCATRPNARNRLYNLSDHTTVEAFVDIIAKGLGKPTPGLRLPKTLMRGMAHTFGWLPRFPLTPSRVDALTNRTTYSIDRVRTELGYAHRVSMQQGLIEVVRAWQSLAR